MAPTTRRRIWWVVGVFIFYEVARLLVAGIAGYISFTNIRDLTGEALQQTKQVAGHRLSTAGVSGNVAHVALSDPLFDWIKSLPHLGADLKVTDLALETVGNVAPQVNKLIHNVPDHQVLASVRPESINAQQLYTAVGHLRGAVRKANHEFAGMKLNTLDFGLGAKVAKAKPVLRLLAVHNDGLQKLLTAALVIAKSGDTAPAYWFIANQNLAEARGTGGLIGSYAVVLVNKGRVTLTSSGSDRELNGLGAVDNSSLPLDTGTIWQDDPSIWQDLNPSANSPFAAQQIADTWIKYKHQHIDGVVFAGQGMAQYLAAAFGPVQVDGVTLDGSNAADFLAKGIYSKYPDVADKNRMVQKIMKALMEAAQEKKPNLGQLFSAISKPRTGDQLNIWSSDKTQQAWNSRHGLAGDVTRAFTQDVTLAINNGGGNKLEAYLHTDADYQICAASGISHFSVKLANVAPRMGLPEYVIGRYDLAPGTRYMVGSNLENVTIYLPIGAEITSVLVDGNSFGAGLYADSGHQILTFNIDINPGKQHTIDVEWTPRKNSKRVQTGNVLTRPMFNPPRIRYLNEGCLK